MNINKILRKVGKKLPLGKAAEDGLRFIAYQFFYKKHLGSVNIKDSDMLMIGTIARSGTHYMMLLLANYIEYMKGSDSGISPSDMNKLFPNNWHLSYMNYYNIPFGPFNSLDPVAPDKSIQLLNVKEVTRSHSSFQKIFWKNKNVIHLYRNPLDYSVSLYKYKHKKRTGLKIAAKSPSEVLDIKFDNYVKMYKSYVQASRSGRYRIFRLSYEELIRNPEFYLGSIITWLGIEPNYKGVKFAVKMSSIKKTKEFEKKGSVINPTTTNLVGSFISSGQIGQWKEFYTKEDYQYWKDRFSIEGIDLDKFTLS